jgi:hypothetical protein
MSGLVKLMALGVLLCAAGASAQDRVYRCGADGRSYSRDPCQAGRAVDVADTRTSAQAQQTHQAALRDARMADALQRERERRERVALNQRAAGIGSAQPAPSSERCAKGRHCAAKQSPKRRHEAAPPLTLYKAAQPS